MKSFYITLSVIFLLKEVDFFKKLWCCVGGVLKDNLFLSIELIKCIGHRKDFLQPTFRASVPCQTEQMMKIGFSQ